MKRRAVVKAATALVNMISVMFAGIVLASQVQGQNENQSSATLTPQQIEDVHAALYFNRNISLDKSGFPVPEIPRLLSSTSGDINLTNIVTSGTPIRADTPTRFAQFACYHDLVVLGTVGTGTSHMTSDKSFLYTDWGFLVERIFKNNSRAPIQIGSSVTVVAPGGNLLVNGRMVHAYDGTFPPLASGRPYLIFLKFVPQTGAYQPKGAYGLSGAKIAASLGAIADRVDTRAMDTGTLLKLMEDGATTATQMPNCKGAANK